MDNGADKCNLVRYTSKKRNEKISSNGSKTRKTLLLFTWLSETNYFLVQMQGTRESDYIVFDWTLCDGTWREKNHRTPNRFFHSLNIYSLCFVFIRLLGILYCLLFKFLVSFSVLESWFSGFRLMLKSYRMVVLIKPLLFLIQSTMLSVFF